MHTNGNELNEARESRGAFLRIPASPGSNPTVLKRYDRFTEAARSPIEVGDSVYFFEGSHPKDGIGHVRSVPKVGSAITDHGVPWRSRRRNPNAQTPEENLTYGNHVRTASNMVYMDENLYGQFGYNDPQYIKSQVWASSELPDGQDIESTRIDNWLFLKYGTNFDFRLPLMLTNGLTGFDIITELVSLCFCYTGFKPDGTFVIQPRFQPKAQLARDIDDGATITRIDYKNSNMVIPESGLVQILGQNHGKELFSYTGRNPENNQLTGVQRSQHQTVADDHCADTSMEFVHHVIHMDDPDIYVRPINELQIRQDLAQLYNIIKMQFGDPELDQEIVSQNANSVDRNKPREQEINVPLTYHNRQWIQWLADQYRDFYSNVRYLVECTLKPSFYIKVGDFILLKENRITLINDLVFQVIEIRHQTEPDQTSITLRSVS